MKNRILDNLLRWFAGRGIVCHFIVFLSLIFTADLRAVETIADIDIYYPISRFELAYQYKGVSELPELETLQDVKISLYRKSEAYVGYATDTLVEKTISELSETAASYHVSALKAIQDQLVKHFNTQGYGGVVVMPAAGEIDLKTLKDLRVFTGGTSGPLKIDIWVARIADLSVVTNNADSDKSANKYAGSLAKIEKYSPVNSSEAIKGSTEPGNMQVDQLRSTALDDYLYELNRHPGRRVDAAVSPGKQAGDVDLKLQARYNKPWLGYVQISNTGSKDTSDFRQRYGFVNNQLTGNDDILNLDYMTTDFDAVNSLSGSYDRPWFDSESVRYRLWLSWSDYRSSEIGSESRFTSGDNSAGFEIRDNMYQKGRLFIDHFAGVELTRYKISNYITSTEAQRADEIMFNPRLGYRLECEGGIKRTFGELMLEFNLSGNSEDEMDDFGRMYPDTNWYKLSWNYSHSFYLEPLMHPDEWNDISTPKSSTLAHELAFSTRGQFTTDRLIPQEKCSVGGMYSVRGYRQGFTSGDTVLQVSGEYRYHVPRAFDISKPKKLPLLNKNFRWAPEQVYGFPDWDFIVRLFIDHAMVINNNKVASEKDYSLSSCGLGVELQLNRYFSIRCDWGTALEKAETTNSDSVDVGDNQIHISGMLAY